ncbi:hypothetical protein ACNF40_06580 [Cuniculiplasma sp. SKW4]|uniref:hypothetical protein n=1 Tax=Cuniculiplasma sp. SKW4 TaxID=3400171 RepID=UPI003FD1B10B
MQNEFISFFPWSSSFIYFEKEHENGGNGMTKRDELGLDDSETYEEDEYDED